jgi:hypothetical protein
VTEPSLGCHPRPIATTSNTGRPNLCPSVHPNHLFPHTAPRLLDEHVRLGCTNLSRYATRRAEYNSQSLFFIFYISSLYDDLDDYAPFTVVTNHLCFPYRSHLRFFSSSLGALSSLFPATITGLLVTFSSDARVSRQSSGQTYWLAQNVTQLTSHLQTSLCSRCCT